MIKYYSYYNCGGYKDMYIGSDSLGVEATYFVPLLPVWKNSNKPGNKEKIDRAEAVTHIGLISNEQSYGFPHECNILFSHGGYKAIYQTLIDGTVCLCIRDIECNSRDEEQRAIPFNFLFVADGEESISKLDSLAIAYLNDSKQIEKIIQKSISYDPILNAIKFNLQELNQIFGNEVVSPISHIPRKIIYLKAADFDKAIKELGIEKETVGAFYNERNIVVSGEIKYESQTINEESSESQNEILESENSANDADNDDIKVNSRMSESEHVEIFNTDEIKPNIDELNTDEMKSYIDDLEIDIDKVYNKVSHLSKEITSLKQLMQNGFNESNQKFSLIENMMSEINKRFDFRLNMKYFENLSFKEIIVFLLVLIVGVTFGALLF